MRIKKINRMKKRKITLHDSDSLGNPRKIVIWYDDLRKVKKPPAWMKEILFSENEAA